MLLEEISGVLPTFWELLAVLCIAGWNDLQMVSLQSLYSANATIDTSLPYTMFHCTNLNERTNSCHCSGVFSGYSPP